MRPKSSVKIGLLGRLSFIDTDHPLFGLNRDVAEYHCIYIHFARPDPMATTASVIVMRVSGYLFFERLMARGSRRNLRFLTGRRTAVSSAVFQICEAELELAAVSIRGRDERSKRSISLKLKASGGKIVGDSRLLHHRPHQVVA